MSVIKCAVEVCPKTSSREQAEDAGWTSHEARIEGHEGAHPVWLCPGHKDVLKPPSPPSFSLR
jgi:hypothetical protein